MKLKQLLTKTLLAVAMLGVGGSAWGDKNYSQIFNYTFEDSETYQDPWAITNSITSQLAISTNNKILFIPDAGNSTNSQIIDFGTSVTGITDYKFSFDYAFSPTGTSQTGTGYSTTILTVYDSNNAEIFHLACEASGNNNATTTSIVNASGTTIGSITTGVRFATPTASSFYTFTITADETNGVVLSVDDYEGNAISLSNSTLNASFKLATKLASTPHIGKYSGTTYPQYNARAAFDNVYFGEAVTGDYASVPTLALTGFDGTSRIFTISCLATETIHYQVKDGDTEKQSGAGASAGASVNVTVPAGQKLIAWTTMGVATSTNVEYTVVGGVPALTAPTVTLSDIGADYSKSYTVSNLTQTITEGAYSYDFEPTSIFYATSSSATSGTNISDNKFTLSAAGTYYVIISAGGDTHASEKVDNTIRYVKSADYDFTSSSILTNVWSDATGTEKWVNTGDAEAYKENSVSGSNSRTDLFEGFTVTDAGQRHNKIHWHNGKGVQFNNSSGNFTIGLTTVPENAIIRNTYYQDGSNRYVLGNTITIGRYNKTTEKQGLVAIDVYTPDPVTLAIADCKTYETSAAFATYIDGLFDGGTLTTAAEVYAAHTAWQIAQAKASASTDITKVIRNAAVDEAGTYWTGVRTWSGEKYTGAPDNYYFDQYQATIDAYQTVYGIPAGKYVLKAATRASAGASGTIYVYAEGQADESEPIHTDGNTGGTLGNGWSWTEVEFTLTATSDVKIGFYADASETGQWAGCDDFHLTLAGESVTIGTSGFATFSSPYALNFDDTAVTPYCASAAADGEVTMTKLMGDIAANTGLFLKGDNGADTYSIPVAATAGTSPATNYLKPTTGSDIYDGEKCQYVYAYQNSTYGFFKVASTLAPAKGKAYLETAASAAGARMTIKFDDEVTGIENLTPALSEGKGAYYDLQGRRVAQPTKGLYIVNGRKVVVK